MQDRPLELFTDGSWSRTHTGPFLHQNQVSTGAALAIMDGATLVAGFRIANAYALLPQRAYIQEHVGLLLASVAATELHLSPPIYTDCRSAMDYIQNPATSQRHSNPLSQMAALSRHFLPHPTISWIKAHCAVDFDQQTDQQKGNTIADAIANGTHPYFTELPLSTLNSIAANSGRWYLYDRTLDLPAIPFLEHRSARTMEVYLSHRQQRHVLSPSAADIKQMVASVKPTSSRQAGAYLKLALRKFDDDRRASSDKPADALPPCSCGCSNTIDTWTTSCRHPESISIRNTGIRLTRELLDSYPLLRAHIIGVISSPPDQGLPWRGTWSEPHITDITNIISGNYPTLSADNWKEGIKVLHQVTRILTQTALQLHTFHRTGARSHTPTKVAKPRFPIQERKTFKPRPAPAPAPLPKITAFFQPVPKSTGPPYRAPVRLASSHSRRQPRIAPLPYQELPHRTSRSSHTRQTPPQRSLISITPSISSLATRNPMFLLTSTRSPPSAAPVRPSGTPLSPPAPSRLCSRPSNTVPITVGPPLVHSVFCPPLPSPPVITPPNYHALLDTE